MSGECPNPECDSVVPAGRQLCPDCGTPAPGGGGTGGDNDSADPGGVDGGSSPVDGTESTDGSSTNERAGAASGIGSEGDASRDAGDASGDGVNADDVSEAKDTGDGTNHVDDDTASGGDDDAKDGDGDDAKDGDSDDAADSTGDDARAAGEDGPADVSLILAGSETVALPEGQPVGETLREALIRLDRPESEWRLVSRPHLRYEFDGGTHYVVDEGSKNGTWVNGERLSAGDRTPIKDGGDLTIARLIKATIRIK